MTTGFEHDIFHNNLKDNLYGQVYSQLQIFRIATKTGIHHRPLVGIISLPKISKKLSLVETLFKMTYD